MPKLNAFSNNACAASSFSMEQKRVPEPKPMQETISPVLPRRRFGSELAAPHDCSAAPSTTAAVVVFRNSRRDQRIFMIAPFWLADAKWHSEHLNPTRSLAVNPHDYALSLLSIGPADPMNI